MIVTMRRLRTFFAGLWAILAGTTAQAQDHLLRGQWEVRAPPYPYVGIMLVDAEGRTTWDSPSDNGIPSQRIGYVTTVADPQVRFALTDRRTVNLMDCILQAADLMTCQVKRSDESHSRIFSLVRVAPGPARLR